MYSSLRLGECCCSFREHFSTLSNFFVFTQSGRILCIPVRLSEDDPFLKPIFKVFEAADAKCNFLKNIRSFALEPDMKPTCVLNASKDLKFNFYANQTHFPFISILLFSYNERGKIKLKSLSKFYESFIK